MEFAARSWSDVGAEEEGERVICHELRRRVTDAYVAQLARGGLRVTVEDEGWQYVWMLQRGDETLRGGRALSAEAVARQASHALCQPV